MSHKVVGAETAPLIERLMRKRLQDLNLRPLGPELIESIDATPITPFGHFLANNP
jgi:hypothetical protein